MTVRPVLTLITAMFACGCGYVGDPLPPALNRPVAVTDLQAVQLGSDIVITYTAPALTTEELGIQQFGSVEIRVGPLPQNFTMDAWAAQAREIPGELPKPGKPGTSRVPAAEWNGREIAVAVRLASTQGRVSAWSNTAIFTPGPPLVRPEVKAAPHPEGLRLTWNPWPGTQYKILRQAEGELTASAAGTSASGEFIDRTAALGKSYTYVVQAFTSERNLSEPSDPVTAVPRDEFAPAAPAGVTAVAGNNSIELAWQRNQESDVAGYRVYRAGGMDTFVVVVDALQATAFSDRQIVSGTRYRYQITAIDRTGNESNRSNAIEIAAP